MRTETVQYEVYKFNELEEKVQEKVLEKLSDINVDGDWWFEGEVDYFKNEKLKEVGFEDAEVHFSGFWNQGDGACFDARVNLEKIINYLGDKRFNRLIKPAHEGFLSMTIEKNSYASHYCHERTRHIDMEASIPEKHRRLNALCDLLKLYVEAVRLRLSREIYDSLRNDYADLTSKEAIVETIEANEYDFLKNGKIF